MTGQGAGKTVTLREILLKREIFIMRKGFFTVFRLIGLTMLHLVLFVVVAGVFSVGDAEAGQGGETAVIGLLLAFLLETAVLSLLITQARWAGWRLAGAIFVLLYGIKTVMAQMETAVFLSQTHLTPETVSRLFLIGLLVALPFALVSVLLWGKWRTPSHLASLQPPRWQLWAALAGLYLLLYFIFGYAIAWQNPAVRVYYGGQDWGSFGQHMLFVLRDTPWLIPFQFVRGFLWLGFIWLLLQMLSGSRWSVALLVGITLAVLMNAQLLITNPYMPETVRLAHLLETAPSNFLFGVVAGWLFLAPQAAVGDELCPRYNDA